MSAETQEETTAESQEKKILAHLQSGKSITGLGALNLFSCFRLPARIHKLKAKGHAIQSQRIEIETSDGRIARVSEYSMEKAS